MPPNQDGGLGRGSSNGGSTKTGGSGPSRGDNGTSPRQLPGNQGEIGRGRPSQGRIDNQPSRSGEVKYRGNNNVDGRQVDGRQSGRPNVVSPQTYGVIKAQSMESMARRQDGSRYNNGLYSNGWRTGYCHYNNNWNDSYFWYPNYCFTPFGNVNIVISPWYSYSFLPGYLNCNHVYVNNYRGYWGWNTGVVYVYDGYSNGYDRFNRNRELDYTINDLEKGFENRDFRALDRLVPDRGQIAIYRDGRYDYSIDTRDFSDLLNDLSSNADTTNYRILESRINRDSARISAVHEYIDQWGSRQRVYHSIYLENERGDYVIREFGTSNSRVW